MKQIVLVGLLLLISACSYSYVERISEPPLPITLRHNFTRAVVRCPYSYQNPNQHLECAQELEAQGYVKIEQTAHLPAKYDFAVEGSYPTRRWREGEVIPRW